MHTHTNPHHTPTESTQNKPRNNTKPVGEGGREGDPGAPEGDQQGAPRLQRLPRLAVRPPLSRVVSLSSSRLG